MFVKKSSPATPNAYLKKRGVIITSISNIISITTEAIRKGGGEGEGNYKQEVREQVNCKRLDNTLIN